MFARKVLQFWKPVVACSASSFLVWTSPIFNDAPLNVDMSPIITMSELSKHSIKDDCWVSIHGHVYDVTDFLESHPGGVDKLLRFAGKDATKSFRMQHTEGYLNMHLPKDCYKGELVKEPKGKKAASKKVNKKAGALVKSNADGDLDEVYQNLAKKHRSAKHKMTEPATINELPPLSQIFNLNDFEAVAKQMLPALVYSYIKSGTDNEYSVFENRRALGRIFFRPRCLVDVHNNSTSTEILGCSSSVPFLIGAFAGSELLNGSDRELVDVASLNGVVPIISENSKTPLDALAPTATLFYQYSIDSKEELENAPANLKSIQAQYPNIKAFFISVDSAAKGNLEHFQKIEAIAHQESAHPAPQIRSPSGKFSLTWEDLVALKSKANVPIVLKGVQTVDDVVRCQKLGFKGALISNHGGKALDQGLSPIEILYNVHKYNGGKAAADFELFVDGGFRRGSDVLKAICLGATPAISTPFLLSQQYGKEGVQRAIDILKSEVVRDMKLLGVSSVSELNSDFLDCESLNFRVSINDADHLYGANYTRTPAPPFRNQSKLVFVT